MTFYHAFHISYPAFQIYWWFSGPRSHNIQVDYSLNLSEYKYTISYKVYANSQICSLFPRSITMYVLKRGNEFSTLH